MRTANAALISGYPKHRKNVRRMSPCANWLKKIRRGPSFGSSSLGNRGPGAIIRAMVGGDGGSARHEVLWCVRVECPIWPFRMRKNSRHDQHKKTADEVERDRVIMTEPRAKQLRAQKGD